MKLSNAIPPWLGRLRRWWTSLAESPSMVRLVGPNSRPLERHEFEVVRSNDVRRIL
jgi:hypothetical protein